MSTERRGDSIERLIEVARALRQRVDALAAGSGVTPTGMRILRLLNTQAALSTSEVARYLNLADEVVSRELRNLVSLEFITREKRGRTNRLKITTDGWTVVRHYEERLEKLNGSLLPDVQLTDFHAAIVKIEARLSITVTHAEGKPRLRTRKRKSSPA